MNRRVSAYYTKMPQADLDALVAILDAHGMKNVLGGLSDWATQAEYGDAEFSFVLGLLWGHAAKLEEERVNEEKAQTRIRDDG